MRIIAYTYEADIHCPACTGLALQSGRNLHMDNDHPNAIQVKHIGMDEFGIPLNVFDREDNRIGVVFSTDENDFTHCSDCGGEL